MSRRGNSDNVPSPFDFGRPPVAGSDKGDAEQPAKLEGTLIAAPGQQEAAPDYAYRKHLLGGGRDEVSVYNEQMRQRHAMDRRVRVIVVLAVVVVALIPLAVILPTHLFGLGGARYSLAEVNMSLAGRVKGFSEMFTGSLEGSLMSIYFWQTLAAALAGAGLALNGAVYQGALRNALASPSTLGVMSGATVGTIIYTLFVYLPRQDNQAAFMHVSDLAAQLEAMSPWDYFLATQARVLCSLAGSAVVVVLVLAVAFFAGRGRVSKVGLLISGQVFAAVITSLIEAIRNYIRNHGTEEQLEAVRYLSAGSFDSLMTFQQVVLLAVPVFVCLIIILALRNRINLLSFDDDEAKTMGLSVNVTRNVAVITCTVLTAVIVAFCGSVGFVGFLVPHLARKLVGPDFRYLVPASVLLGAAYLVLAFYLSNASGILQGSVGTVTSIIGLIGFVVLAVRNRREGNVEWL